MARWLTNKKTIARRAALILAILILSPANTISLQPASAAQLADRSIRVSDAQAAQNNVTYRVGLTTPSTSLVGSVRIQFCTNTSLIDDVTCTPPAGFDISSATLSSQTGMTGFVVSSNTTANEMVISRPPVLEPPTAAAFVFTGVVNPFNGGTLFARVFTYPTSDGTGAFTDGGGLALYFRPSFGVSAEVPPFLKFCLGESISAFDCSTVTDPFSDIGILSPLVTGLAQSQMVVATNADGGYSMWVLGGTMTSGNNIIPAMGGGVSQTGVSQFGINFRANTGPVIGQDPSGPGVATLASGYDQANQFRFQSGDLVASANGPDDNRKYTVSYIVNVNASQPGGVYATTLTYVALANF